MPKYLIIVHATSAVALVWLINSGRGGAVSQIAFDALIYADATLIGMWAGWGRHSKAAGFAGVGATTAAMASLVLGSLWHSISGPMGPGNDVWVTVWLFLFQLALALLSMAVVVAAIVSLRKRRIELAVASVSDSGREPGPVHFSLRQLLLLMVAVGVLLKLGPLARAYLNDYRSYLASVVALGSGGVCLGAVGLAGMWAVFGGPPSFIRTPAALVVAAVLGLFPPYYFPELLSGDFAASVAITSLESAIVIGTLSMVRACGYRLEVDNSRSRKY
jgi:hypothetical protein